MDNRARARAQLNAALAPVSQAQEPTPPPSHPAAEPEPKAPRDRRHTSITIPTPVHRKLREIAFYEETSINDVILRAIDELLERRGDRPTS